MKKKMVNHVDDSSNPPAMTAAQKAELKALRAKPETRSTAVIFRHCKRISGRRQCQTRFIGKRKPQQLCASIPTCCIGCALMAVRTLRSAAASIAGPLPR